MTRPKKLQQHLNAVYDQLNQIDREAQEQMRNYLTAMNRTGRRAALAKLQQLARALRPAVKLTANEEG
jgi:alpha-D-ribose 1-methylphosphonate 5-triphosphate synthase subunit PhnH